MNDSTSVRASRPLSVFLIRIVSGLYAFGYFFGPGLFQAVTGNPERRSILSILMKWEPNAVRGPVVEVLDFVLVPLSGFLALWFFYRSFRWEQRLDPVESVSPGSSKLPGFLKKNDEH